MKCDDSDARAALRTIFAAAIASADPRHVLASHLPPPPDRCVVVGGGKSAALMAVALEAAWPATELRGLVVTRYGHAVPTRHIEVVEAAHPVPDDAGEAAARRMLAMIKGLSADTLVIALMSGGGSALLTLPAPGLTLADKQYVNRALLAGGATITEMNTVRKHLSAIKGGRLAAAAAPAQVITLAISDVPGDDPAVIASGPTVPRPDQLRRCAGDPGALRHHAAASRGRASAARRARDPEARRPCGRFPHDCHAVHGVARLCRDRRPPRPQPADPRRCAGG